SESINYFHEADARSDADWLVGFNLSPFVTIKMKEAGLLDKKEPSMSVGRVQTPIRSEEHTSELQSRFELVCRLLLEKKNPSGKAGGKARSASRAGQFRRIRGAIRSG